tara:strand:+ start:154 stop:417 length:264 start_codon:yes stop_codon:yes gene_type:complete
MKLSKEMYNYILECIAIEDNSWRDDNHTYLPMKEEATKWIKAVWEKQEKGKLKKLKDLKPGEGSSKLQDPKERLTQWYAKNNVKIGI